MSVVAGIFGEEIVGSELISADFEKRLGRIVVEGCDVKGPGL